MTPDELNAAIGAGQAPPVIDVRERTEFDEGRVPGAANIPFWRFLCSAPRVPALPDQPLVIYCGHGPRARIARAALRVRGYRRVILMAGHMSAWRAAGLPEERLD